MSWNGFMPKFDHQDFLVVNAFTDEPFGGNPAGVFPNAEGLSDREMQAIARQLNLVETVFVFEPPDSEIDRHLRYFTPLKELPVAGHPTVAAWAALANEELVSLEENSVFRQLTGAGIQTITLKDFGGRRVIWMEQPPPRYLKVIEDRACVAETFGISLSDLCEEKPVQAIDTGLGHIIVPVRTLDALLKAERNIDALKVLCEKFEAQEAQLYARETRDSRCDLHTRNLCPRQGVEDPACGVGNGALGAYLAKYDYREQEEFSFVAEQGHVVEMPSTVEVAVVQSGDAVPQVSIGGSGRVMVKGRMDIGR